jgi:hypothetical protein
MSLWPSPPWHSPCESLPGVPPFTIGKHTAFLAVGAAPLSSPPGSGADCRCGGLPLHAVATAAAAAAAAALPSGAVVPGGGCHRKLHGTVGCECGGGGGVRAGPSDSAVMKAVRERRKRRRDPRFVRQYGDYHPQDLPDDIEYVRNPFLGTSVYVWGGLQVRCARLTVCRQVPRREPVLCAWGAPAVMLLHACNCDASGFSCASSSSGATCVVTVQFKTRDEAVASRNAFLAAVDARKAAVPAWSLLHPKPPQACGPPMGFPPVASKAVSAGGSGATTGGATSGGGGGGVGGGGGSDDARVAAALVPCGAESTFTRFHTSTQYDCPTRVPTFASPFSAPQPQLTAPAGDLRATLDRMRDECGFGLGSKPAKQLRWRATAMGGEACHEAGVPPVLEIHANTSR